MKRTKPALLLFGTIIVAVIAVQLAKRQQIAFSKPRLVLLYATCTVNKDYLSPYTAGIRYTPNFKTFARDSVVFTEHETEGCFSGSAYACLFTGTHVFRNGVYYHPSHLNGNNYLVAEAFQDNGYETFFWNMQYLASEKLNYAQGIPPQNVIPRQPGDGHTLTSRDDRFASILRKLKLQGNYKAYCQVNFSLTHSPYTKNSDLHSIELFCQNFPEECVDITGEDLSQYLQLYSTNHIGLSFRFDETAKSLKLTPDQIRKLANVVGIAYKSNISRLDKTFGETIEAIREAGLLEESLIVFTSDHGEILYREDAARKWGHGVLEPEVLSIPLMIHLPKAQERGSLYSKVTRSIDVFPTLAGFCHLRLPQPGDLDGIDLSQAILGQKIGPDLIAFACSELPHPAVARDDPSNMTVQARAGDRVYRLRPDGKMQGFHLANGRLMESPDLHEGSGSEMERQLRNYRNHLIRGYTAEGDQSDWNEVRERLRSLGYLH